MTRRSTFLRNLTPVERRAALQQLCVAFIKTAKYVPPPAVTPEATTAPTARSSRRVKARRRSSPRRRVSWHALLGAKLDRDGRSDPA